MAILAVCLAGGILFADDYTIHIQNPWPGEGCNSISITGQYTDFNEGAAMTPEGGGWFSYTLTETGPSDWRFGKWMSFICRDDTRLNYTLKGDFPTAPSVFFQGDASAREVWLVVSDVASLPQALYRKPISVVVNVYNPWQTSVPRAILGDGAGLALQPSYDYCGWYTTGTMTVGSAPRLKFQDVRNDDLFTAAGYGNGGFISLAQYIDNDTIWILPWDGGPTIETSFPGKTGECATKTLTALVRDRTDTPEFGFAIDEGLDKRGPVTPDMVLSTLTADGRLQKNPSVDCFSEGLESWFETQTLSNGQTNDTCVELELRKDSNGYWSYTNTAFLPIDGFNPNGQSTFWNGHNWLFTMELHTTFEYFAGQNQMFKFRGDDDVWVFINNRLAIDLGGVHVAKEDSVFLDESAGVLGLSDGEMFSLDVFYCERNCCASNFLMFTTLDLSGVRGLYYSTRDLGDNVTQYDMYKMNDTGQTECGMNFNTSDTSEASVDFSIEGPQFGTNSVPLSTGSSHGGITVSQDFTTLVIDTAACRESGQLSPGTYTISYQLKGSMDPNMRGMIRITVGGKKRAGLWAEPGSGALFGDSIRIVLRTEPDAVIYYTLDGTAPDKSGTGDNRSATFTVSDRDTVVVRAVATGTIYYDSAATFYYYRDVVGPVVAGPGTMMFPDSVVVFLDVVGRDGEQIYYTLNGGAPDRNSTLYTGRVPVKSTTVLRAIAYDDDAIHSGVTTETYTRMIVVESAWYLDVNGDGVVDNAVIRLGEKTGARPTTVRVEHPCGNNEIFAFSGSEISMDADSQHIRIGPITEFGSRPVTEILAGVRGYLDSADGFNPNGFAIRDSVAPVISSAVYSPGRIENKNTLARAPDTLGVIFTEDAGHSPDYATPYRFTGSNGEYDIHLRQLKTSGNTTTYLVDSTRQNGEPVDGDSIWIDIAADVADRNGNTQKVVDNRRAELRVKERPHLLVVQALTPFDPRDDNACTFPPEVGECLDGPVSGTFAIADFLTVVKAEIRAEAVVYDAVGNTVISCGGIDDDDNREVVDIGIMEDNTTKVVFGWSGRNSNGRYAGAGTYLLVLTVCRGNGAPEVFRFLLGIVDG